MALNKKQRLSLITFLLSGFLFILGGITLLEEEKIILGSIQILAGISNIVILVFKNPSIKGKLEFVILLFNVVVATTVAFDYISEGRKYLQYAWFLAAFLSGVALVMTRKHRTSTVRNS